MKIIKSGSGKWEVGSVLLILLFATAYSLLPTPCLYSIGFELGAVRPKIITPNDDHHNDMLFVSYNNPDDSNVSGKILTINGSYAANMQVSNSDPDDPKITWDGKDNSGKVVSSGIYIYQVEVEGQIFNGTVVVAK